MTKKNVMFGWTVPLKRILALMCVRSLKTWCLGWAARVAWRKERCLAWCERLELRRSSLSPLKRTLLHVRPPPSLPPSAHTLPSRACFVFSFLRFPGQTWKWMLQSRLLHRHTCRKRYVPPHAFILSSLHWPRSIINDHVPRWNASWCRCHDVTHAVRPTGEEEK